MGVPDSVIKKEKERKGIEIKMFLLIGNDMIKLKIPRNLKKKKNNPRINSELIKATGYNIDKPK